MMDAEATRRTHIGTALFVAGAFCTKYLYSAHFRTLHKHTKRALWIRTEGNKVS
jgi:hypothetical protein